MGKTLRKAVIRLAYACPELRVDLLPLVAKTAGVPENILSPGDHSGTPADVFEFMAKWEAIIKRHFPQGYVFARASKKFGHFSMYFATATLPKGKQQNGIIENDPSHQTYWMHDSYDESGLHPKIKVEMSRGGRLRMPDKYDEFGRGVSEKIGWRNKTGTPVQILAHFNRYYAKLAKMVQSAGL